MTDDLERARREAAELLGLDPDKLTPGDRLKCELIAALRAAVDDELAKVTSARAADVGKLIIAVETLTRFLADAKPKANEQHSIFRQDPHKVLEDIVARWIAADEADRREKGLSAPMYDLESAQARIDELESELIRLRGALPSPESDRVITPSEGDIVPPGEQTDRNLFRGAPRSGPDDPRPAPTIDAKPAGSWTGPKDGPPSWLKPVAPVAKRVDGGPPQTCSGDESKRRMVAVNSDRSLEHRVMGASRMPQPDAGGFHWGGSKGRAW